MRSEGRQTVLQSAVIQRDIESSSSSPGDRSDVTSNAGSYISSVRSGISFTSMVNQLKDDNLGESLTDIRKRLASLEKEKEKELISLIQNLNKIEAKKNSRISIES